MVTIDYLASARMIRPPETLAEFLARLAALEAEVAAAVKRYLR